ncbi:MAG: glutamate--tRNA ligase family protein [Bacteroidota bacterium]|nr:glutamate--tRNA ligase family protein [Candidatus Kapabacteria bacterium]MDW8219702.1 glutamate--tRNA ligase family protein [Bacteroidota bacterium]
MPVSTCPRNIRSRLAPTPSGLLHIGNVLSFLLTWLIVRKLGGSLHLRIDDLDTDRAKPAYYDDIFATLEWLHLDVDSGPRSFAECRQYWSQRHRQVQYNSLLRTLALNGDVFACECSRSQLLRQEPTNIYPGNCRAKNIPLDTPHTAWRIRLTETDVISFRDGRLGQVCVKASTIGDSIVRRRDGIPSYHIASLADDVQENITLIVRGEDLLHSTAVQMILAQRLRLDQFCRVQFVHHPLVCDSTGNKLSKSHNALSIKVMREQGTTVEDIYQRCAEWLGISVAQPSLQALLDAFPVQEWLPTSI